MKVTVRDGLLVWGDVVLGPADRPLVAHGDPLEVPGSVRATLAPMPGGDVVLAIKGGILGIERKTLGDLMSSHASGHLAQQLGIMLDCYDLVTLAVEVGEGWSLFWPDNPTLAQDLLSYQELGVRLTVVADRDALAALILRLPDYFERGVHHALDRTGAQDSAVYRRMLTAAPGWGIITAQAALAGLGPPIQVFNAPTERLVAIKGVSARKVQQLFAALGRRLNVSRRATEGQRTHNYGRGNGAGRKPARRPRQDIP